MIRSARYSSPVHYAKDLIDVATMPRKQILDLLRLAASLKKKQHHGIPHRLLVGKTLGLLFQKPSTRTRVSFEAGMNQLGGHALGLPMGDIQLSRGDGLRHRTGLVPVPRWDRHTDLRSFDRRRVGRRGHHAGH